MLEKAYFLDKNWKNRLSVGGSAREPRLPPPPDPRIVTSAYYYNFVQFIYSAKCDLLPFKKNKITTVN